MLFDKNSCNVQVKRLFIFGSVKKLFDKNSYNVQVKRLFIFDRVKMLFDKNSYNVQVKHLFAELASTANQNVTHKNVLYYE